MCRVPVVIVSIPPSLYSCTPLPQLVCLRVRHTVTPNVDPQHHESPEVRSPLCIVLQLYVLSLIEGLPRAISQQDKACSAHTQQAHCLRYILTISWLASFLDLSPIKPI
ncbi:hypothetical protein TNCV_2571661 [Trichonephila clavipes]|nr:hypothetical protein TNCV_2571661 [Trichonephila clavipes]